MGAPRHDERAAAAAAAVAVHTQPGLDTPANAAVVALLRAQLAAGRQAAVSVAAYRHGRLIVHAWGGAGAREDTLFMAASVSKGCVATAMAVLHARGLLDYGAPVSTYWPDFAAAGKGGVTVEEVRAARERGSDAAAAAAAAL
jgi:CubicO group peptidase (beta-lactamase class C family)